MTEEYDSISHLKGIMNARNELIYSDLKALEKSLRSLVVKADLMKKSVKELMALYAYAGCIKAEMATYKKSKDARIRTAAGAVITQANNLQTLITEVVKHKTGKTPEELLKKVPDAPPFDDPDEMEERLEAWIRSGRPIPFDPRQLPEID
ncbi:MAG: hypothetical protein AAF560_25060 [Acidobacteriota bacterium]